MHKEKNKEGKWLTEIKGIFRQLGSPLFQNKARKYIGDPNKTLD